MRTQKQKQKQRVTSVNTNKNSLTVHVHTGKRKAPPRRRRQRQGVRSMPLMNQQRYISRSFATPDYSLNIMRTTPTETAGERSARIEAAAKPTVAPTLSQPTPTVAPAALAPPAAPAALAAPAAQPEAQPETQPEAAATPAQTTILPPNFTPSPVPPDRSLDQTAMTEVGGVDGTVVGPLQDAIHGRTAQMKAVDVELEKQRSIRQEARDLAREYTVSPASSPPPPPQEWPTTQGITETGRGVRITKDIPKRVVSAMAGTFRRKQRAAWEPPGQTAFSPVVSTPVGRPAIFIPGEGVGEPDIPYFTPPPIDQFGSLALSPRRPTTPRPRPRPKRRPASARPHDENKDGNFWRRGEVGP